MLERRPSQEIRYGLSIMRKKKKKAKTVRDQNENRDGKMEQEGGD